MLKKFKPITPGRRGMEILDYKAEITCPKPLVRKLLEAKRHRTSCRNNLGRISVRGRGGGCKRKIRIIDFKRDKFNVPGIVKTIEYDPNRSANIALIKYKDGEYRYILAPKGLSVGDEVISGEDVPIKVGNALPLRKIPLGTDIHNIELRRGCGGQLIRSAGARAQILAKEGDYAHVKLITSGEVRLIHLDCMATIGQVGNLDHFNVSSGKAGRSIWLGRRPKTRGIAKNPVDHPMGGGEGRSKSGEHPRSPWGWLCKGRKTRHNKRTDRFIIKRRK